jgi:hypothetical protein
MKTPAWVERLQAKAPKSQAAQTDWLLHRHHCWDPAGGPMPADLLDKGDPTTDPRQRDNPEVTYRDIDRNVGIGS